METLDYYGKPMKWEPINTETDSLLDMLHDLEPVVVKLEPGDASHYALLLVPCGASGVAGNLGRFGVPAADAERYCIAVRLDDKKGEQSFIRLEAACGTWDTDALSRGNPWTAELLAWWFRGLQEKIEERQAALPTADDVYGILSGEAAE
jgi:hypothetical protein